MAWVQNRTALVASAFMTCLPLCIPAHAFELEFLDGDLTVDVRSQLNYGISTSIEKVDKDLVWGLPSRHPLTEDADVATGHGGGGGNVSGDDGRLGHKRGVYQNQFKGITDIRANWGDFGAIVKVLYFYDAEVMDQGPKKITEPHNVWTGMDGAPGGAALVDTGVRATREIDYNDDALREIGADLRTTEMYTYYDGYISDIVETGTFVDDIGLTVRLGDQIIRWGQSTFAPGISIFNPLDANRVLTPGFDIAELAKPVGGLFISAAVTDWLIVETWAGYDFEPLQIPPGGSFFTYYDVAGAGRDDYSGTGTGFCIPFTQHENRWDVVNGHPSGLGGSCLPLQKPQFAKDDGQFGLRVTFASPFELVNQFSVYALRYHNTFPVVQVTQAGVIPNAIPCEFVDDPLIRAGDGEGAALGAFLNVGDDETEESDCRTALPYSTAGHVTDEFMKAGLAWVEGLTAYGFSWSGNLPFWGIAWAGEVSYKKDFPLQVSVGEVFSANAHAYSNTDNINGALVAGFNVPEFLTGRELDDLTNGFLYIPRNIDCRDYNTALCAPAQSINGNGFADVTPGVGSSQDVGGIDGTFAIGANPAGTPAQGYWPLDVYQANITLTKILSNMLWQDNIIVLWEGVYSYVHGFDTGFGFDAPNLKLIEPLLEPTAEKSGWGYRMLLLAQNPGIFGSKIDMTTTFIFFHDVKGTTTTNLNLFIEGRKQGILEFGFKYGTFLTSVRYLGFLGAEGQNPFSDRDSLQLNFRWTI